MKLETHKSPNLILATILMMIAAIPAFAVGTVTQSVSPIGPAPATGPDLRTYVLQITWAGDSANGSVPSTLLNSIVANTAMQGMRISSVEIQPGSPSPTAGYAITLTDGSGADLLNGLGGALSATLSSSSASVLSPPLLGIPTFNLTGNSVNSAQGKILIYFVPLSIAASARGVPATVAANNTLTGNNTFTALNGCQYVNAAQSLAAAIAAVSNPGCIVVSINYSLTATATIPTGVTLIGVGNGGITTTGFTLNVNGPLVLPPSQFFYGTGTVNLSATAVGQGVLPQWWGAVADGVTDSAPATRSALAALPNGAGTLLIPQGIYRWNSQVVASPGQTWQGTGIPERWRLGLFNSAPTKILYFGTGSAAAIVPAMSTTFDTFTLRNLQLDGVNATGAVDGFDLNASAMNANIEGILFENVTITNFPRNQIRATGTVFDVTFHRLQCHNRNQAVTGPLIYFDDTGTAGQDGQLTLDDVFLLPYTAGQWAFIADSTNDVRFINGTVAPYVTTPGANGVWVNGGCEIISTHFENIDTTSSGNIAFRYTGVNGCQFRPSQLSFFGIDIQIGMPVGSTYTTAKGTVINPASGAAGAIIAGSVNSGVTSGVVISAGGSRRGTVIETLGFPAGAATAVSDLRSSSDGVNEVIYRHNTLIQTPTTLQWQEGPAQTSIASIDVCYADQTAHSLKCSYNNGTFFNLPLVGTANTWSGNQSFNSGTILPSAAGGTDLGSALLPFGNLWLGTAATNNFKFAPAATAAARTITVPDPLGNDTLTFLAATQTLTNKTITSPTISSPTITTSLTQPETTAPSGSAGNDVCYGDSTAHNIRCNLNNTGFGPLITAAPCTTSQRTESALDNNLLTCAIPAQAGSYRIRFMLDVSAASAATLGWTVTYTDSNGSGFAQPNLALFQEGVAAPALTFTISAGGNFEGSTDIQVNNAGTSIVVKLTFSGTSFTGKASATVERII